MKKNTARKPSPAALAKAARLEAKKNATYPDARADAQARADSTGFDYGLEWNDVFAQWHSFMLPSRQYRCGHELRCEVVSCSNFAKCQAGHGPASIAR